MPLTQIDARTDELLRQRAYLAADRVARILVAAIGLLLTMAFTNPFLVIMAASVYLLTEWLQPQLLRRIDADFFRLRYWLILANALVGSTAFMTPAALLWFGPFPQLRIASMAYITGILLNAAMARAIHLPLGLATSFAPCILLLALTAPPPGDLSSEHLFTFAAAILLIAYFVTAMVTNHRAQHALASARRAAENANFAKSRFISAMSHDMRTPLNAIKGAGQLLAVEQNLDDSRSRGQIIEAAATTLAMMVDDVLDVATAQDQRITIVQTPGQLRPSLQAVLEQSQAKLRSRQQVIVADIDALPELAVFDPVRLRQCLRNALAAASDYFGPGSLHLTGKCTDAANGMWLVQFLISGTEDITPHDHDTIYHVLSDNIAKAMGGEFAPPGAAQHPFTLRVMIGRLDDPMTHSGADAAPRPLHNILVVDDIATNRLVVVQMLRHLGMDSTEAASGEAALMALSSQTFDAILLDLNMPGMDGAATLQAIRAQSGQPNIAVIGLTADAEAARQRDLLFRAGMDGLITKPIDSAVLLAEIDRATMARAKRPI